MIGLERRVGDDGRREITGGGDARTFNKGPSMGLVVKIQWDELQKHKPFAACHGVCNGASVEDSPELPNKCIHLPDEGIGEGPLCQQFNWVSVAAGRVFSIYTSTRFSLQEVGLTAGVKSSHHLGRDSTPRVSPMGSTATIRISCLVSGITSSRKDTNTSALNSTSDKKTAPLRDKVNHQTVMPNGGSTILTGSAGSTMGHPTSELKVENSADIGQSSLVGKGMDITAASSKEKPAELKLPPNNILPLKRDHAKSHQDHSDGKKVGNNLTANSLQDDSGTVSKPPEIFTNTSGPSEQERLILNFNSVDWTGRMLKVEDQKAFYHSCRINGLVYKVKDHVLVRFSNRLIPSKLEAMWEDTNNKTKWVIVNRYYFPSDLPKDVGRPYRLERSEVYGSIISCTVMAGFIQGPCEVLSPIAFLEEKERRANAGKIRKKRKKPIETLPPLFLCKWIYDESRVVFRDVVTC